MFGSLGYWASSKGMVTVPDLSGMTESEASEALSSKVLSYIKTTTTETTDSSLVGKVASQSVIAGNLVDYESIISISLYVYLCVPNWVQYEVSRSSTTWSGNCVSNSESGTYIIYYNNVDSNGCSPSYPSSITVNTTRSCTPPCVSNWQSVPTDSQVSWSGNCVNNSESGTFTRYYTVTDLNGCANSYTTQPQTLTTSRACSSCSGVCIPGPREYETSPYSADCFWQYVYQTYVDSGCGTYCYRTFIGKGILCE